MAAAAQDLQITGKRGVGRCDPLPDGAGQVEDAQGALVEGQAADRVSAGGCDLVDLAAGRQGRSTTGKRAGRRRTAAGRFPFGLAGQSFIDKAAVAAGIVEGQALDGILLVAGRGKV